MAMDMIALHQSLIRELTEFTELLQRELEEDSEMTKARVNNYRLLQLVLEKPELHPKDYDKVLYNNYGIDRSADIHKQLRASKLYTSENRQRLGRIMRDISLKAFNLLNDKSDDSNQEFDDVARIVRHHRFYERRVEGKIFLIALISLPSWETISRSKELLDSLDILENIGQKGSYKLCREVARRLVDVLGTGYGIEKRKTSTDRMTDLLEDIAYTRDVEDMRATLLIIQRESKHLKEQFDAEVLNHKQEFIYNFFARMNSVRNGELLDSIAQTDSLIQKLQKEGWMIKPELQAIPMIIQVFVNFLRGEGIEPIEITGEVRELSGKDLSSYEFLGTANIKPEARVKVIVRTPGWRLGDAIISQPKVEEVRS